MLKVWSVVVSLSNETGDTQNEPASMMAPILTKKSRPGSFQLKSGNGPDKRLTCDEAVSNLSTEELPQLKKLAMIAFEMNNTVISDNLKDLLRVLTTRHGHAQ